MSIQEIGMAIGTALAIIGIAVTWLRSFGPSRFLPNSGQSLKDRLDDCIGDRARYRDERDELRALVAEAVRQQLRGRMR